MGHTQVSSILVSHCSAPSVPSIFSSSSSSLTINHLRGGTRHTSSRCSPSVTSL